MNAKEFLELVRNFDQLDQKMYREILKLTQEYPYFLPPYIMAAKYEKKASKGYSKEKLHDAALRSPDRKWLKLLMEGKTETMIHLNKEETSPEPLNDPTPTASNDDVKSEKRMDNPKLQDMNSPSKNTYPSSDVENERKIEKKSGANREDILKKLEENLNRFKKKTEDEPIIKSTQIVLDEEETGLDLIDSIKKKEKKQIKDPELIKQKDLIKKFTKKSIKISPVTSELKQEDLSLDSVRPKLEFVSEPMANLLVRQQKFDEAKSMYEKLMLKFPDKKAYFADVIKKLDKKS